MENFNEDKIFNTVKDSTGTLNLDYMLGLSSDDSAINTRQFGDLNNKFLESGGFENTADYLNSAYVKSQGNKNITLNLGGGESITFNTNDIIPIDIKSGQINDFGDWNVFVGKHSDGTTKIINMKDLGIDKWQLSWESDTISEHPLLSAGDKTIDLEGRGEDRIGRGDKYVGTLESGGNKGFVHIKDVNEFEWLGAELHDFGF